MERQILIADYNVFPSWFIPRPAKNFQLNAF